MDLVRAVLQLKNEISLLPPEGYILVVKVGREGATPGEWGQELGMSLLSDIHQASFSGGSCTWRRKRFQHS